VTAEGPFRLQVFGFIWGRIGLLGLAAVEAGMAITESPEQAALRRIAEQQARIARQ
jgi:hypothetical protein